ncbi:MAG: AMP-binding protein [Pseudomonadota bacterium]
MLRTELPSHEHFFQLFEMHAQNTQTQNRTAIYSNAENKISYQDLNNRVNQLAHYLLDAKNTVNPPETRIGLFFHLSIEYIICQLAIMKAGLSFVAFSTNTEFERLQEFAKQSQIKLMLSSLDLKNHLFLIHSQAKILFVDAQQDVLNAYPADEPANKVMLDQLAYIHNTSGSTGKPKQVLINHAGLLNCATDLINRLEITEQDKTAAFADISFDAHIAEMMMTLGAGAALYLVPEQTRLNYLSLTKYYNSHGITVSTLTPSVLNALSPTSFPTLRVLLSTGEAVTQKIVAKWCAANSNLLFVNGYGPAEVTIATSIAILKPDDPIHIGTPIKGLKIYILEKEPKDMNAPTWVKPGERGEMYIAGVGVGRGYADDKLTAERFKTVKNPDNPDELIRLYQTRDEASYEITANNSYRFYLSGRLDRQVKVYGKLICPEEIEALLLNDLVIQAQVDPQKTPAGHPSFIAYLHVKEPFDLYEYYASVVKKLPAATAPARWVITDKTQLSTSSKNALKSLAPKVVRVQSHSQAKPKSTREIELATIWKNVLEISEDIQFTLDDNFFMLGGTSLQMANLLVILREQFQLKLSPAEFVSTATLGALARRIKRLKNENNAINPAILLNSKHTVSQTETPLFLIHSLIGDAELDYKKLVEAGSSQRSIYGISSRSYKNFEDMDTCLEAIADDYIATLKAIQPRGPYLLAGWSAGGLIAYAMCQQLKNQNEKVCLHIIDSEAFSTYHQQSKEDYAAYLFLLFERKLSPMLGVTTLAIDKNALAALAKTKQLYQFFAALFSAVEATQSNQALLQSKKGLIVTVQNTLLAILHYTDMRKVDNALLWAATETQKKCASDRLGWQESEIEFTTIQKLDGNHESILLDPASAKSLSSQLAQACAQQITRSALDEIIAYLKNSQLAYVKGAEDQDLYTPLEGCYDLSEPNYKRYKLLEDIILPFLNNTEKETLLLLAEAGSGKTIFSQYLTHYLWQSPASLSKKIIPLYIRLSNPKIKDLKTSIIEDTLITYGLLNPEITLLLNNSQFTFCFIFDGVDELFRKDPTSQNFYATNNIHAKFPNSHCIFTARLSVFKAENFEELFEPMDAYGRTLIPSRRAKTVMLAPFDETSKLMYISKYIKDRPVPKLGYTDVNTVYKRIQSIPALNDIVGQPILLMMTMKVLHYLEAFYKVENKQQDSLVIQRDLFHMYTHDLYMRASDKKKERSGIISVGNRSVYDCILEYSIHLAKIMKINGHVEISEEALFDDDNPFGDSNTSQLKAPALLGYKRLFCQSYLPEYFTRKDHYEMINIGREGCELLRPRGKPGSFIYSFIHDAFLTYFAELLPVVIKQGRRKQIQDFIDKYNIKQVVRFQSSSYSTNLFQPHSTDISPVSIQTSRPEP